MTGDLLPCGPQLYGASSFPNIQVPSQAQSMQLLSVPVEVPEGGYHQPQRECSLVMESPPPAVTPYKDGRGNAFPAQGWGCPWESSWGASFFTAQSGIPPSGDDTIVLLHKFERLGGGGEEPSQALPACATRSSTTTQIRVSQQTRGQWPATKSAEASLGVSPQRFHFTASLAWPG